MIKRLSQKLLQYSSNYSNLQLRCFCKVPEPQKIIIKEEDLQWKYIRGGGPGGQKTNKTSNCVQLTHIPTGTIVKCHKSRELETNKNLAFKSLKEKLDNQINGDISKEALK